MRYNHCHWIGLVYLHASGVLGQAGSGSGSMSLSALVVASFYSAPMSR
jgi:hypothetical protein